MTRCAALVLFIACSACATNPVTGKREFSLMSEAQEIQIGQEQDAQIRKEMGVYDEADLQQYVIDIGLRLARLSERPGLPWKFTVVDAAAINAFALPGGFIYVSRGILPFLDNERSSPASSATRSGMSRRATRPSNTRGRPALSSA